MTRSTGRSKASTGRMNTRTTNRASACAWFLGAASRAGGGAHGVRAAAAGAKSKRPSGDKGDKSDEGRRAREDAAADPAEGAGGEGRAGHRGAARGDPPARGLPAREPARARPASVPRSRPRRSTSSPSSTGRSRRRSTSRRWGPTRRPSRPATPIARPAREVPHRPPTIDLTRAQATYLQLIDQYPKFRKIDTVIYLYAFSLRDQQKIGESIKYFQIILDKYPRSRYLADAWMAIAEYRFYEQQNYKSSLEAYEKVLKYPKSSLYDLALFKTAWCYWKLGDTNKSALRFKDVLDLAKKKAGRSEDQQKRAEELQGEALDYLVELFTEDDTKTARDAFEFLAQIGGKQYSRKVLKQLADTVFDQTRYERAVEAYRLLIELDPNASDAPDYAGKIVEGYQLLGDIKTAVERDAQAGQRLRRPQRLGRRQQGSAEDRRARPHDGRGAHPQPGQDDARGGAAEREGDQGRRQGSLRARRRGLPVLPGQLPRRARRRGAALPARRHPLLQARQVRGRRTRVPGGRQDPAGRQVPQGCAPASDGRL